MTVAEIGAMSLRELPAGVKRALSWIGIGFLVAAGGAGWKNVEASQNTRLTTLEEWRDTTQTQLGPLVRLSEYNACRGAQIDRGRDPSGCAFFLPPELRDRLVPPEP